MEWLQICENYSPFFSTHANRISVSGKHPLFAYGFGVCQKGMIYCCLFARTSIKVQTIRSGNYALLWNPIIRLVSVSIIEIIVCHNYETILHFSCRGSSKRFEKQYYTFRHLYYSPLSPFVIPPNFHSNVYRAKSMKKRGGRGKGKKPMNSRLHSLEIE